MSLPRAIPTQRLVVFSGCAHYCREGRIVAHGGFVREIEIWARILPKVLVVTVLGTDEPPADAIPYAAPGISCSMLRPASRTTGLTGKLRLVALAAQWTAAALPLLKPDDIIMARGPDSLGFLGGVLARIKGSPRFAKYADQWQRFPGEPLGYRLQKAFYRGPWFGGPVQIYGSPDPRRPQLVPFFTSSLSEKEWLQAGEYIAGRKSAPPWRILFCGRFVTAKGIDLLLQAFKLLLESGTPAELELVGDGEEMPGLVKLSRALGVQDRVVFHGWLGRDALLQQYSRAHLFVHCSRKEGFGKVIIEAMAFGLPVIATNVGVSRFLVDPPECGVLAEPGDRQSLAEHLIQMATHPEQANRMGLAARARVRQFLFEKLEHQYREFLATQYGISFNQPQFAASGS
jgi:hypothetical protein